MMKKIFFCAFLLFGRNFLLPGQQKVMFKTGVIAPSIVSVVHLYVAGNFNGWNPADKTWELVPDSSDGFQLLKQMPAGVYNFKVTKGSWQTVECNASGKPIDNRNLVISHDTSVIINIAGWQDSFTTETRSPERAGLT